MTVLRRIGLAAGMLGFLIGLAGPAAAEPASPADAPWIVNADDRTSILVVRRPEGPPPGIEGKRPPPPKQAPVDLGRPAAVNVLSVAQDDGQTRIRTKFIPDYVAVMTPELRAALQARPRYADDFPKGVKAADGARIAFGQDIGYGGDTCAPGAGRGYWPPATFCAAADTRDIFLPNRPEPADETCFTTLGPVGIFLNGVILFNWSDGQSFAAEDVWHNTALTFEQYDLDICLGHAAEGIYHHHSYAPCLAAAIGDTGAGHSPVWGFSADGYPIHGPWHARGLPARSCWKPRDYGAGSPTGCARPGQRDCQLVDREDAGKGVQAVAAGPAVGEVVLSLFSKNPIAADSGAYFEDYYFDPACAAAGGAALDAHNGHDHDGLGYHFHLTVDAAMNPVFPYSFGPVYRGRLQQRAMTRCGAAPFSGPPRAALPGAAPVRRADRDAGLRAAGKDWARVDPAAVAARF